MAFSMTIDAEEIRKLERQLAIVGQDGRKASFRGRKRAAQRIVRLQKRAAPKDLGDLTRSIHVEAEQGPTGGLALLTLATGASVDEVLTVADTVYAQRQEFEHEGRKQRKRPHSDVIVRADATHKKGYMRKTAHNNAHLIVEEVGKEMRRTFR